MSRWLPVAIALLAVVAVGSCRAEPVDSKGDLDGLAILWSDADGQVTLDAWQGGRADRIVLPAGEASWISYGADDAVAVTRAGGPVALRSATSPDWHDLEATDASGDAPPTPSWFATWSPDGGRLAMLAGDLAGGDAVSLVFADPTTASAFTIPVDAHVLPAPPAWLDDDRIVLIVGDADAPGARIVDATNGSIDPGPSGIRFVATSTDGSTVATLAPAAPGIELRDTSAWLAGGDGPFATIPAPTDGATPIAFALDADGGRLAVAWRRPDGTVSVSAYARSDAWRPAASRTLDDRARGAVVGWLGRGERVGRRPCRRRAQAVGTGSGAAKIETWASSGSITPMTFWRVRRWTQDPQLSK